MLLTVRHATSYRFADRISHGLQRLRLKPKSTHGQEVLDWSMDLSGVTLEASYEDHHHNHTDLVSIEPGTPEVVIVSQGTVRTIDNNGVTGPHTGHMPLWAFLRPTPLTTPGPRMRELLASVPGDRGDVLEYLHALSRAVAERVSYVTGVSDARTTAEQALAAGQGVCQDHAHIFITAGRLLDIPMRYVGGYLLMEDRIEQDAGHGWAEAHVPGLGWVGFDVSNGISPDRRYIRVSTGSDYSESAPVTGIAVGAGDTRLDVHLSVEKDSGSGQQQQQSAAGGQEQSQRG